MESGRFPGTTQDELILYTHVLGVRVHARAYPTGAPLRDVAQLAVTRRFRAKLAPGWRVSLEAPLPIAGNAILLI